MRCRTTVKSGSTVCSEDSLLSKSRERAVAREPNRTGVCCEAVNVISTLMAWLSLTETDNEGMRVLLQSVRIIPWLSHRITAVAAASGNVMY